MAAYLSSGERAWLLACFAFWNGDRALPFSDLLVLDNNHRAAIAELFIAEGLGEEAVDRWLERQA